jgi:tungstate transport system ATP-binding protein
MIELTGLKANYAERSALVIEALRFEAGKRYALIGANGSGKSTLLRVLAGTLAPSAGVVKTDLTGKGAVGYLPQVPYGFSFSVLKNVLIATDNGPGCVEKATAALEAVGLSALINADASKLSGGETQRMAFARMITMPRKLLLLDEPTAATDLHGIDLLEAALLKYCAENQCTVIFATHSPAQAVRLANEIVFLQQGQVVEQGDTKQVLRNPQSKGAQAFLRHWKI